MAILHGTALPPDVVAGSVFRAESVSFTSSAGDISSFRSVPAGKVWQVQALRAIHREAGDRDVELMVADADGTTYAVLKRMLVPQSRACYWDGALVLPEGWRLYAKFYGMAGGVADNNWQYLAIEL